MKDIVHCSCCPNYKKRLDEFEAIVPVIENQIEFLREEYKDVVSYITWDYNRKSHMCG